MTVDDPRDAQPSSPPDGPILVTGATGFIGRATVAALDAQGAAVRAGFRSARPTDLPDGAIPVPCPLAAGPALAAAVEGTSAVVHTAYGRPDSVAAETAALLAALDAAGTTRLVHLSSIAVYGDRSGSVPETVALGTHKGDPYGRAKIAAEWAIVEWTLAEPARTAVILRPGIVYGTGSALWVDGLLRRMRAGGWGVFEDAGDGIAAAVHVSDVADAARRATWRRLIPGVHAVNVVGSQTPTWNEYTQALGDAAGLSPVPRIDRATRLRNRSLQLPAKLAAKLGLSLWSAAAAAPRPGEEALLNRRADYRTDTASRLLGLRSWTGLEEGLWRTFER